MAIVKRDENMKPTNMSNTHAPELCASRLCDVHGRFGCEPWAHWPRNWRGDRGMMEMTDPKSGIGHPSPAQHQYWSFLLKGGFVDARWVDAEMIHGCDGGCGGAYDQVD